METGYIETCGLRLFYRYWSAATSRLGVILCIHGLASDSRIFSYFGEIASKQGHDVYAIDLRGYGASEGEKGDAPFDLTMACMHGVVSAISKKYDDHKVFMLGFSVGGLHALWYARLHPELLRGLILLSPHLRIEGVRRNPSTEPTPEVISAAIQKYQTSPAEKVHIGMAVPNAFGELAGEEWVQMLKDPICNFYYSYRYIFEVLMGRSEKIDELYKTKVPLLILHGENDHLTLPDHSATFLDRCQSSDKELVLIDGSDHWFYHAMFYDQNKYSEEQRRLVIDTIDKWIEKRAVMKEL